MLLILGLLLAHLHSQECMKLGGVMIKNSQHNNVCVVCPKPYKTILDKNGKAICIKK